MPQQQRSIALVVPAFNEGGGVSAMARFLYHTIASSGRYRVDIFSLALSSRDEYSLRLLAPQSWFNAPQITREQQNGYTFYRVGAFFSEFEFQRYQPRRAMTMLLNQYDLVQVVAGTPSWAYLTCQVQCPVCLFTATTIRNERVSVLKCVTGLRWLWLRIMTEFNAHIEQAALRQVTWVFAESIYTRQNLLAIVPAQRLCLGVPGVDTTLFVPVAYQSTSYILTVGRFNDQRKNIRLLFDAYAKLRQSLPNAPRLMLAGSQAPTELDWRYAGSLQITDWIDVREGVPLPELAQLYQNASLFVLSSDEEGLGIVIIEAMASGLPVVSTRCGGPETAVIEGVTGCLTPIGDAAAMADAMGRLLDDPDLRWRMATRAREVAEQRFSLAAAGQVYLDCYDRLLG